MTSLLYASIPDLAGYLIKANSEGQPGPLTYNRTLSSGANLFARSLSPYGGIVMFRAFVYNQHLSESDWKADRANAAVEFFKELDGLFDDNVIVQIKYGPIDFQVREPVSPLFSHLRKTNAAVELQVSQEYLGQQCHLVYLAPMWKETLSFDLKVEDKESKVSDIISGHRFNRPLGGSAAVVNVGTNTSWLGSHLALSNLYAYGQLAWNPSLSPESILQDWISLTFSSDPEVISIITSLSLQSWPVYESYTGNLGMQTLTDILYTHFGPNPASMDNNGWGQWTRADSFSIGMDRTLSNGTGFSSQYPPSISAMYENITTTPEELLLWFHHVPYRHLLPSSGKTIIQHIYDEHYSGAETAQTFPKRFSKLEGKVDTQRFEEIMYRLTYQAGHAIVWRDVVANFYHNLSGIPDSQGRVGNHPWRVEAESMTLDGYQTVLPDRPEMASNSSAIITTSPSLPGTATTTLTFPSGVYDIAVGFFDLESGRANYTLSLNNKTVGNWIGNSEDFLGKAGSTHLDGHSATRVTFKGIEIEKGDVLRLVGRPDGGERAPVDYVVFLPTGGEAVVD
ncbi:hypothetical protein G7Y89_g5824 [Cudoniella acicularis]|uniref:Alpha-glucuronidase n=1 Tax=Cudoniella acicularis TaxID=354080 RepID=A0A8H4W651_9HELO|nr:hypothetical protein G7Y89_g5824 [Cudoniella acicularis]